MDTPINNKFNFKFVKPLYKRAKIGGSNVIVKSSLPNCYDKDIKLCGDGFNVKTLVKNGANEINVKRKIFKEYKVLLPGACEINGENVQTLKDDAKRLNNEYNKPLSDIKMLGTSNVDKTNKIIENQKPSQSILDRNIVYHKVAETWLRVYPAKKLPYESLYSILLRCFLCQLGLSTFLILWTVIAVFVIQSYEGPHETKVSIEFEKEQNQLVIDLATELRQITPLSPKWRFAIEKRIEDERQLTMRAVDDGAKLKPGQFWDLPGTFLFAVYVMTALGFGAPVPHTILGRTSALIYAFLAIPTHIYLMMNASTCLIIHFEEYMKNLKNNFCGKFNELKQDNQNNKDNANCSRNSEIMKTSDNRWNLYKHLIRCLGIISVGRFVPLSTVSYYTIGAVSFGVLRAKTPLETIMFPLEFTTTGGLERVEGHVRILYGLYVEGAMCLLACVLAILRRHGSSGLSCLSDTYRLFATDKCNECSGKERV